ncbi:hypothetical protein SteCoe_39159 [Stentor coeruleus]|uniref:Uncharacterized protein n=1 Tax=Stentor coeruleus TaxID=5963 RepID=A0A1R2AKW1_9CILI|nr:hypothetical protein SteCoe_39159 [Stentor coeruleus]
MDINRFINNEAVESANENEGHLVEEHDENIDMYLLLEGDNLKEPGYIASDSDTGGIEDDQINQPNEPTVMIVADDDERKELLRRQVMIDELRTHPKPVDELYFDWKSIPKYLKFDGVFAIENSGHIYRTLASNSNRLPNSPPFEETEYGKRYLEIELSKRHASSAEHLGNKEKIKLNGFSAFDSYLVQYKKFVKPSNYNKNIFNLDFHDIISKSDDLSKETVIAKKAFLNKVLPCMFNLQEINKINIDMGASKPLILEKIDVDIDEKNNKIILMKFKNEQELAKLNKQLNDTKNKFLNDFNNEKLELNKLLEEYKEASISKLNEKDNKILKLQKSLMNANMIIDEKNKDIKDVIIS